jgi:hypothetical protein
LELEFAWFSRLLFLCSSLRFLFNTLSDCCCYLQWKNLNLQSGAAS